jgi:hypothetical protein
MSNVAIAPRTQINAAQPRKAVGQPEHSSRLVTELQVSANLMTLEPGLFCIFQAPGSPAPDPATGLPGVRITPAPGIAGRPEAIGVCTFREDGWLNGTAALVQVMDGSAQLLVTVYQPKGMEAAPRLQVLRLNGRAAIADAPQGSAYEDPARPPVELAESARPPEVMAHIQRLGDVGCKLGEWLGKRGSRQWIEGFGIAPDNGIVLEDLEYQAVLGRNWLSPWVEGGKFCGSRGMALPLLGLKVRLKGAAAVSFECSYSATFLDGSAVGPIVSGGACQAESLAALEALQIVIRPHGRIVDEGSERGPAAKAAVKVKPAPRPAAKGRVAT